MTDFKPGDKVRVTYEAVYDKPNASEHAVSVGDYGYLAPHGSVELIERADDPSKDPVGTVREGFNAPMVKVRHDVWHTVRNNTQKVLPFDDSQAEGHIIGAVPGTPAAEVNYGPYTEVRET